MDSPITSPSHLCRNCGNCGNPRPIRAKCYVDNAPSVDLPLVTVTEVVKLSGINNVDPPSVRVSHTLPNGPHGEVAC